MKIIPDKAKVWLATKGVGSGMTTWVRCFYEPKKYKRTPTKEDKHWCAMIIRGIQSGNCEAWFERIPNENINIIKKRVTIRGEFLLQFIIDDSFLHAQCLIESLSTPSGAGGIAEYKFSSQVISCDVCDTVRFHTKMADHYEDLLNNGYARLV